MSNSGSVSGRMAHVATIHQIITAMATVMTKQSEYYDIMISLFIIRMNIAAIIVVIGGFPSQRLQI